MAHAWLGERSAQYHAAGWGVAVFWAELALRSCRPGAYPADGQLALRGPRSGSLTSLSGCHAHCGRLRVLHPGPAHELITWWLYE
jgi:hypothetical protein